MNTGQVQEVLGILIFIPATKFMKRLPRISRTGDFSTAWNQQIAPILDENFREARIQPGIGCRVSSSPGGQSIVVNRPVRKSEIPPFSVVFDSGENGITIRLTPGTVSGFLPSNILSRISVDLGAPVYVWIEVTAQDGAVTGCTVAAGSSAFTGQTPTASAPPATFQIPAAVILDGVAYNLLAKNWVNALPVVAFTTYSGETNTPTPWYVWNW